MTHPVVALETPARSSAIWWLAFGYLAAYAPYSALAKALSKGLGPAEGQAISGLSLLPVATCASLVAMVAYLSVMRWWRFASTRTLGGLQVPCPTRWTFVSGVCTAAIILTTTLAYTIPGTSIVLMMVLLRGGVLVIAPLVDGLSGRRVRWYSWVALALSAGALTDVLWRLDDTSLPLAAVADVGVYLAAYLGRLLTMTRLAKGGADANRRYFVEEQMVATPVAMGVLSALALSGQGTVATAVRDGFALAGVGTLWLWIVGVGVLSQLTGVFGGLIFLDPRENSFCVPVNRASSMIAGVLASFGLAVAYDQAPPTVHELLGAGLMVLATLVLGVGPRLGSRPLATRG